MLAGELGLLMFPQAAGWLWVLVLGLTALLFPLSLVLLGMRTRAHGRTVALTWFAQGLGYAFGSFGPLLFGSLHFLTTGWLASMPSLVLSTAMLAIAAVALKTPAFVEDELERAAEAKATRTRESFTARVPRGE